jgi:hypothetical protein
LGFCGKVFVTLKAAARAVAAATPKLAAISAAAVFQQSLLLLQWCAHTGKGDIKNIATA